MGNAGGYHPRMADIDLTPTEEMASNAARGLELREKHGRGGTAVGVARARDIKNRKNLSPDTVRRMHSFFSRHAGNETGGEDDAGYISFLLWGGAAGRSWAKRKSAQLDKDENAMSDTRKEIMERLGMAAHPGAKAAFATEVGRKGNKAAMISRDPNGGWKAWVVQRGSTGIGQFEDILGRMRSYATEEKAKRAVIAALDTSGFSRPGAKATMAVNETEVRKSIASDIAEMMRVWNKIMATAKKQFPNASSDELYQIALGAMKSQLKMSRPGAKAKMADVGSNDNKIRYLLGEAESAVAHLPAAEARKMVADYIRKAELLVEAKTPAELTSRIRRVKSMAARPGAKAKMAKSANEQASMIAHYRAVTELLEQARDKFRRMNDATSLDEKKKIIAEVKYYSAAQEASIAQLKREGLIRSSRPGAKARHALTDACWQGYEAVGTKQKDGKTVPNCVPKNKNAIREGEKVSASDDAVSRKIRKLMDEGKPQKQAVAIALDLERRGEL
jgi:hypothetical protein